MRSAWQEFRTGWHDARRSFYTLIGLLPIALLVSLAVQISHGQVPPQVVTWFYATLTGFVSGVTATVVFVKQGKYLRLGWNSPYTDTRPGQEGRPLVGVRGGQVGKRPRFQQ